MSASEGLEAGDAARVYLERARSAVSVGRSPSPELLVQLAQAAALLYVGDRLADLVELNGGEV